MNISFDKNWELENEKKIGVLMFQKVAKTGNIGEKKRLPITFLQFCSSNPFFFFSLYPNNWGLSW